VGPVATREQGSDSESDVAATPTPPDGYEEVGDDATEGIPVVPLPRMRYAHSLAGLLVC
jgi:hypothetical protein